MPHTKCELFATIKYRSNSVRLFTANSTNAKNLPNSPNSRAEIWISFDDICGFAPKNSANSANSASNENSANKAYAHIEKNWRASDKVKKFKIINSTASTNSTANNSTANNSTANNSTAYIEVISQYNAVKFLAEVGASETATEWLHVHISAEIETRARNAIEDAKNKEIADLRAELDKWRGGKQDTVYILNFYPYDDGIYKIGLTDKIERRVADFNTGTPSEIVVEYNRDCGNKRIVEQMMHYILEKYRVNPNKEFFRISKQTAITMLNSVVDFVDGMHEIMSAEANNKGEDTEIDSMINKFASLTVSKARSTILPDMRAQAPVHTYAPAPNLYPSLDFDNHHNNHNNHHNNHQNHHPQWNTPSPQVNMGQYSHFGDDSPNPSITAQKKHKKGWLPW